MSRVSDLVLEVEYRVIEGFTSLRIAEDLKIPISDVLDIEYSMDYGYDASAEYEEYVDTY